MILVLVDFYYLWYLYVSFV